MSLFWMESINKRNTISNNAKQKEKDILYTNCIFNVINNASVRSMERFIQHSNVSCLEHCVNVSYYSFLVCRFFGLDCCSAARGGLLHDLFLYDWHVTSPKEGKHAFIHPSIALQNAEIFELNDIEKDIIKKHMWPLTIVPPRYPESFIVSLIDKYCAVIETFKLFRKNRRRINLLVSNT